MQGVAPEEGMQDCAGEHTGADVPELPPQAATMLASKKNATVPRILPPVSGQCRPPLL